MSCISLMLNHKGESIVFIFVNPNAGHPDARQLEQQLIRSLEPTGMEVYHQLRSFVFRLKEKIHDIGLVAIVVLDAEVLELIEAIRADLDGLPLIFIVSPSVASEEMRLYRFFPRIVLRIKSDDVLIKNFIKAKMGVPAAGGTGGVDRQILH